MKLPARPAAAGKNQRPQYVCDAAAAVLLALFAAVFFSAARYGVQNADESAYYTFCHRLLFGDAPIVNEWSMTQLSFVFQYLPFRIFYAMTGGTEGCILFLRYFFVVLKLLFFAGIYLLLRQYRVWALTAATVFTGFLPSGLMTLSYYNIAPAAVLIAGMLLFTRGEPGKLRCGAAGFAFACAVICAPLCAAVWLLYSLAVLIAVFRKKRKESGGLLSGRAWLAVTAGVALCAVIYLAVLFISGGIKQVFEAIPELLRDKTFASETPGLAGRLHPEKFRRLYYLFGPLSLILNALYLIAAPIVKKYLPGMRSFFLPVGFVIYLFTLVRFHVYSSWIGGMGEIIYLPLLLCLPGLACLLLTEKKDRRLAAFFLFGLLSSVCMDLPSNISFGGGMVAACVPAMLLTGNLARELRGGAAADEHAQEQKKKNAGGSLSRVLPAVCAAAFLLTLAGTEGYCAYLTRSHPTLEYFNFHETADSMTATVSRGPLKGLRTMPLIQKLCENAMDDLDLIRSNSDGPFYTADFCPWFYLYADLPYGTYSTSYVKEDSRDRLMRYWEKFPEAVPEYVYIPTFNCDSYHSGDEIPAIEQLNWLTAVFECETTRGKTGYILRLGSRK